MRRPTITVLLLLAASLLLGACGDTIDPYAAKVNGNVLPQDALDEELDAMAANDQYLQSLQQQGNTVLGRGDGTFDLQFVTRVLTRQIYLEVVHQEFVRRKLRLADADLDLVRADVVREVGGEEVFGKFSRSYRNTLVERAALVAKVQMALSGQSVNVDAARAFYEQNQSLFVEACTSHILFAVLQPNGQVDTASTEAQSPQLQAAAAAAKARVDAGEDFAVVARELSQDASNREQGGDLGCGPAGRFVPEFEQALGTLQPGQVSAPVKTQFGWHLIKVTSRGPKPFEEVAEEIRQRLLSQAQEGFGGFLGEQLAKARVSVNPRYGRFAKGPNPGVVPLSPPTTPKEGGLSAQTAGPAEPDPFQLGG